MKIYIIIGETGEYSDYTSWIVKAFTHKESAEDFIKVLDKECEVIKMELKNKD